MTHRVAATVLMLSLLGPALARGDSPSAGPPLANLTLQRALSLADAGSPLLAAAEAETRARRGRLRQAGLTPNPELSITEANLLNDRLSGFDGRASTYELEQPIELGGRRAARKEAARAATDLAGIDATVARLEVRAATTHAFQATLAATERVRIARAALELAERVEGVARARVEAGRIAPIEESRASILVASARIELERLSAELELDLSRLAATWGSAPQVASVEGSLEVASPLPPLETLQSLLVDRPDVSRWSAILRERNALTRQARAEGSPDFSLTGGWTNYQDAGESAWLFGVRIGLPLANRNQGAVSEALALREKADAERRGAEVEVRFRLASAHRRASLSAATAQALATEVLPAARLTFDSVTEGFEAGKLPYLDVLDARRTLLDAERQHLEAVATQQQAHAEVLRLVGDITQPGSDGGTPAGVTP